MCFGTEMKIMQIIFGGAVQVKGCVSYLLRVCLSHLANAGGLNELWELKRRLLKTSLALQVLPLLTPMPWHWNSVPVCLQQLKPFIKDMSLSTNTLDKVLSAQ